MFFHAFSRRLFAAGQRNLFAAAGLLAVCCLALAALPDAGGQQQPEGTSPMLRHVVLFQFKDASSEADIQRVVDAFRALPKKISEIADFEYGVNNSPEGLSDGHTHCFLVTFRSEADRDAYLPHPEHKAFVEVLKPHLQKATVVDYWAKQ
jgi:hypothetical protein